MLFLVATPIGNLKDITFRAIEVLQACDYILAEDTRHSLILLKHYGIEKRLVSFHEFNEKEREEQIVDDLRKGMNIALISDAGTPLVSDPGFMLVKRCIEDELDVTTIPGPCAIIGALTLSGFSMNPFQFVGFLHRTEGKLTTQLASILEYPGTTVAYESPHRVYKSMKILAKLAPERKVCVARELTKKFETILHGTAAELSAQIQDSVKGEVVLCIAPSSDKKI